MENHRFCESPSSGSASARRPDSYRLHIPTINSKPMENVVKPSISVILIVCIPPVPRLAASADCPFRPHPHRRSHGAHTAIIAKTIGKPYVSATYPILEHRHEVRHGIEKDSVLLRAARASSSEFAAERSSHLSSFHVICICICIGFIFIFYH